MFNMHKEKFNARNLKRVDFEQAGRNIRERHYNYEVDITVLYTLRSLINDEIRNAENKKQKFFEAMQKHDDRVFKRPGDAYPIHVGGYPINEYLNVLGKVKSLGSTEFDEYWSES
ncbi:hypothetical protein [Rossellomorea yichunensis]|uniref:hypothetical protein n=1 Tax=Rossellomorea yichunensis TaxID=3077331 RepID=UPI0028DDBC59|nr:hypothetical protein [Rossellomorea sp. YC4-1]MDT9027879.1 hypothetical protein [Rossellomorea sp. YC4-1]